MAYLICGKEDEMCESKKASKLEYYPYKNTKDTKQKKKKEWTGPGHMNALFMHCIICKLKHIFVYFLINYKNYCISKFSIKKKT